MSATSTQQARYKRSVKNYLIDSRFQLKYTSVLVLVAVSIAVFLGVFLWSTSRTVVNETREAIRQGADAVKKSNDLSQNLRNEFELMKSCVDDPSYCSEIIETNLKDTVASSTEETDDHYRDRLKRLEDQGAAIEDGQKSMRYIVAGALLAMVTLIGMFGIYFTHKVAGPIFKMKRLLKQVGEGKLTFEGRLRKGDELQDFFETFATMVEALRERQRREIAELERAIEIAESSGASKESVARVVLVRDEMKRALEA